MSGLLQTSHPRHRRHTTSGLGHFFKTAMGGAFVSFFEKTVGGKPTVEDNEKAIKECFREINEIIEAVDEHITQRMENHEEEIFALVKEEIEQIRLETEQTIEKLNDRIKQLNVDTEMWNLNNELDYFKSITFKLYQENKEYRVRIKLIEKKLQGFVVEKDCMNVTMQKFRKKFLREQSKNKQEGGTERKDKKEEKMKGTLKNKSKEGFSRRYEDKLKVEELKVFHNLGESHLKQPEPESENSVIDIKLSNNPARVPPSPYLPPQPESPSGSNLIELLTLHDSNHAPIAPSYVNSLPPARLTRVDSYECHTESQMDNSIESEIMSSLVAEGRRTRYNESKNKKERSGKMVERGVQTEDNVKMQVKEMDNFIKTRPKYHNSNIKKGSMLYRSQRCNTEQRIEPIVIHPSEERESTSRQIFRVAVHPVKKESKSILYMSNAIRKSKMREASTVREYSNAFL